MLPELSASSCVTILHSLAQVNRLLDGVGWWKGHASALATRKVGAMLWLSAVVE